MADMSDTKAEIVSFLWPFPMFSLQNKAKKRNKGVRSWLRLGNAAHSSG
ncbi:hypothetical protein [Methylocaldum marinum]|nr:hypothetical protein [Methylocaldum marinum]